MRLLLTGGGTGGHITPLLSLADYADKKGDQILYVGGIKQMEEKLAKQAGLDFIGLPFSRHCPAKKGGNIVVGFLKARQIIKKFKPQVIFSKGSGVSLPVVLAAAGEKIPILIHETDSVPGRINAFSTRYAALTCLGYPAAAKFFKGNTRWVGNFIGPNAANGDASKITRDESKPTILIIGGSQGARSINDAIIPLLPELTKKYNVFHQCGATDCQTVQHRTQELDNYQSFDFIGDELANLYAAADMIISRAGGTSIAEILHYQKPSILIPLPWAYRDHQRLNAQAVANQKLAILLPQDNLDQLGPLINKTVADRELKQRLSEYQPHDTVKDVYDLLRQYA